MVVGLRKKGLQITAVTTSSVTSKQAEGLNIPLKSIDQVDVVDVTVDGADEVDSRFNGIKGGGGAPSDGEGCSNALKRIYFG